MYRYLFAAMLVLAGCGDAEPLEKNATSANNTSANGNPFANNSSSNGMTANAVANNSNIPDPMFENPCTDGPLAAPIANCAPVPLPSTGVPEEDCVRRINQFRWECQCLPPLERWTEGEQCADEQADYDRRNLQAHKGFADNICSPRGSAQNECPDWNSWEQVIGQCLQMMWDEGPGEDFNAHGHYINMSSTNFSRVACGSGGNWYVQNFQ